MIEALVLDQSAITLFSRSLILDSFLDNFKIHDSSDRLKQGTQGTVRYFLAKNASLETPILVLNLKQIDLKSAPDGRKWFQRIMRVALKSMDKNIVIPAAWAPYHEGSRISIYAEGLNSTTDYRLYFDTCPRGDDGSVFAFAVSEGPRRLDEHEPEWDLYRRAKEGLLEAIVAEPEVVTPEDGQFGITLAEPIGAQIAGMISLQDWLARRATVPQLKFIASPLTGPVRLKGAAGTGKTQAIAIKALKEMRDANEASRALRLAVITHSEALADEVILGMLYAMDPASEWEHFAAQHLFVGTLYKLAERLLNYEGKGLKPLSLDGREGRELQRILISDAIDSVRTRPDILLTIEESAGAELKRLLDPENSDHLISEIMNEFASIIDADNIQKGSIEAERYLKSDREGHSFSLNEWDRKFLLDVHEIYSDELLEQDFMSMDQMISDLNKYLASHAWRRLRQEQGFDAILVDEYHFFNRNEAASFHHLFKATAGIDGNLPLFMAYDLKQGTSDAGLVGRTSPQFMATRAGHSDLVELTEVFRSTPEIAAFLQSIDGSFPALDLEGEWSTYAGKSQLEHGDRPTLKTFATNQALIDHVFRSASESAHSIDGGGRQVAVICLNERLFDVYRQAGRGKGLHVPVVSREEMAELKYARRKFVLSMPEYVAGLQFEEVHLINVDEADFDIKHGVNAQRRMISRLYLGASRARNKLYLHSANEQRGPAKILTGSLSNGTLMQG
ncbi:UvrD-helicase domain-containing protein [Sphingomonas rhizophila]|uniref:DNA 3'-5' helicase II n=1 Tax=Sphingomonas rhizophila TaxID=2071607 RepID=A0A7G9SCJ0_9SPHN|nr:UvrD-helicase domain-containing protein [Sphingomonas rhizophila]QNN65565.1 UvrD-helicase domain-containing protein [Sphingomonas rhizophila]